ncbi:unnamed protein product [Durusdinium trenchii]|uniref:Pentatricopeptide repeat-containing protein, chloroplastic n=1 Tax=Durusdinium trenchii TaxID=1381693 RepID=A0ABP0SUQ0_9DINO
MAQPTRALRACEKIENGQNAFCWSNALAVLEISRNVADQRAALSTSVINACSKAAEWCRGVQLLHQADGSRVELNLVKFNALLNVKGREWQQVVSWLRLAESFSVEGDRITFGSEISAVGSNSQWLHAIFFVHESQSRSISVDIISLNSAMSACNSAFQWAASLAVLADLTLNRVCSVQGINTFVMNSALSAFGQVDMWQETMLMLQEMERGMGLRPSLVTRSVAMSACTFVGPWDISLYQMSLVVGGNEVTCSTAISACALGSLWANALSLLGVAITNSWPIRLRSVNDAIAYCGRQKQWQWVLYVLGQLERLRVQGDVITYTSAISACERSQLWKEAFLLFSLTSRTVQANIVTYNAGITALSAKGKWQKTCLLLRELHMQRLAFDAVTCGASVGVCREGGNWEAAFSLLACLDEVHLQSEAIGFSTGIDACGAASEWRKSLVLLQELPWKDAIAHNSAITACGDVAQWQLALQLLKEVDSIGISGAYGASLLFTSAIAACKTCWQHACYLLARMQDIQLQANLFAYNAALGACEQSGRWQEAVLLLKAVRGVRICCPFQGPESRQCHGLTCAQRDFARAFQIQLEELGPGSEQKSSELAELLKNCGIFHEFFYPALPEEETGDYQDSVTGDDVGM